MSTQSEEGREGRREEEHGVEEEQKQVICPSWLACRCAFKLGRCDHDRPHKDCFMCHDIGRVHGHCDWEGNCAITSNGHGKPTSKCPRYVTNGCVTIGESCLEKHTEEQ